MCLGSISKNLVECFPSNFNPRKPGGRALLSHSVNSAAKPSIKMVSGVGIKFRGYGINFI